MQTAKEVIEKHGEQNALIKIVATSHDEVRIAYFTHAQRNEIGAFIIDHSYINDWTCVVSCVDSRWFILS